jgi:hypothetical protein
VSEWKTCPAYLELWSTKTGIKGRFEKTEPTDLDDDPMGMNLAVAQVAQFIVEFGYIEGDPDVLMPEDVSWSICCPTLIVLC